MFNADAYITELIDLLQSSFGERLLYVGLQGSYLRGEATEESDIDIMVIIRNITVNDLDKYKNAILTLDGFEKSCGFILSVVPFFVLMASATSVRKSVKLLTLLIIQEC